MSSNWHARHTNSPEKLLEDYSLRDQETEIQRMKREALLQEDAAHIFSNCDFSEKLSGNGKKCVYFIRRKDAKTGRGIYKIGRATDLYTRLSGLQTGSIETLVVALAIYHDRHDLLEELLHDKFKSKNVRGEWYDLDCKDFLFIAEMYYDRIIVYKGCPPKFEPRKRPALEK